MDSDRDLEVKISSSAVSLPLMTLGVISAQCQFGERLACTHNNIRIA